MEAQRTAGSGRMRFLVPAFLCLSAVYLALAALYDARTRTLAHVQDVWFGADIVRHIEWVLDWRSYPAARLHPASFALYKLYGLLLRPFGASWDTPMLVFSLPSVLLTAASLTWCAHRLARLISPRRDSYLRARQGAGLPWILLVLLVGIGPSLLFAPLPESHTLGGAALMLQALYLLAARSRSADTPAARRVFLFGALASAFTLGNLIPAAVLFFFLPPPVRRRYRTWGAAVVVLFVLFWLTAGLLREIRSGGGSLIGSGPGGSDLRFVHPITFGSLWSSFRQLVTLQFGIAPTRLVTYPDFYEGLPIRKLYPDLGRAVVPAVAFLAAALGIAHAVVRRRPDLNRGWFLACGLSLLSLVGVHAFYDTREAYLFSAHAWPFVSLPCAALLASCLRARARAPVPVLFVIAAFALSLVQIAFGLKELVEQMARM